MKILFIAADTSALGGIQQYNRKFLAALRARGDSIKTVEIRGEGIFLKTRFIINALFQGIFCRPNIIICAHVNYAPLGLFLKKIAGRRYIVCTHGVDVWDIKNRLQRKSLREAKVITTVAEFTRDKMVAQMPELKEKIYFLYNPVDGKRFIPKPKSETLIKRYGLEGKKVIFTVARLKAEEGYKGYDRVVKAMPEVLKSVPNAVYLLVGGGDDMPRVGRLIKETGVKHEVIMTGPCPNEELPDYYNIADVFVMPSKAEGAPAVFVEALCCGKPVIAGNQDGSSTPLQGGEVGLLINPDSIEEIAEAIVKVLNDNIDKRLLDGEFLRRKTLEKFGLDRFPEKVEGMLKKFLE